MTFHVDIELENEAYAALVNALGSRALTGKPCTAGELVSEWLTADNNDLEARAQSIVVDQSPLLASLRASSAVREALAQANEEAEFTEPPLPTPAWSDSHLVVVGPPVDTTALTWPPGYTLHLGKAPEPAELPEVGGGGVPFDPVTPPIGPLPTPADLAEIDTAVIEAEEADQERNPQPRKPRRTKSEMALARNAVTNAYRAAVGNSPWSAGWEAAHVAGLAAADVAGANAGLTPYQTRQTVSPIVDSVREQFDEPRISAPDTADHGPDDVAVQRIEDIVTNEQPPKHVDRQAHAAKLLSDLARAEATAAEPAPPAEVAAIHGLPSAPALTLEEAADLVLRQQPPAPTDDDDIFAQFLNG